MGSPPALLSRRPPKNEPPHSAPGRSCRPRCRAEATVITRTSRWATCESSCASTPSSSSAVRRRRMPVVTQTTERSGERPVANALGRRGRRSATRGLGMSAIAHSRSIMPCSSGASSGVTSRARMARIATLSELYHCQTATPMPTTPIRSADAGTRSRTASARRTIRRTAAPSRNITSVIRAVSPGSCRRSVNVPCVRVSPGRRREQRRAGSAGGSAPGISPSSLSSSRTSSIVASAGGRIRSDSSRLSTGWATPRCGRRSRSRSARWRTPPRRRTRPRPRSPRRAR